MARDFRKYHTTIFSYGLTLSGLCAGDIDLTGDQGGWAMHTEVSEGVHGFGGTLFKMHGTWFVDIASIVIVLCILSET